MVDVGQLDYILKNVVNTIKQSQQQINDISEEALKEWNELQQRLVDIQCQIRLIIDEVDGLDKLLRRSRQRLAEVSKNFQIFSEEDIKAAYDEASELQLKLALKRQLEKQLQEQRKDIEQRVKRVKDTLEKADRISSQIAAALALITSDLNGIASELQDMQFKEFMNNRIIMAQEEERQRLARDIHDGPAQSMSNLLLKAELCDRLLDTDVRAAHNELSELKNMIRNSLSEIRKVIFDLRPMSLDDLGLIPTLVQYVEDFEKESGITVDLKIKGNHTVALKSIVEVAVFRVIQEALNNVRKHSHAKNVLIYLEFLDKMLNIRINDDGVGFDSKTILKTEEREHTAGFGLYSMKERVTLLNGKFDIITSPGEGTTIFASIPIEREHKTNG